MKALRWLRDHWYIVVLVLIAMVGFVIAAHDPLARRLKRVWLDRELEVVKAKAKARRQAAEQGAEAAAQQVKEDYRDAYQRLEEEQKAEAETLEQDPAALAAYLVRAGAPDSL